MTDQVISLTRGVPAIETFPTEELIDCAGDALRRDSSVILQYGRSPGYAPLREWLAEHCGVEADRVLIGNGSLEILSFITRVLLEPGARVFVESPSYDRTITLLRRAGANVVGIPMEPDGVSLDALDAALSAGPPSLMYTIADFQNPLGVTTSLDKRTRLAQLAEEHGFWLVEDAPYRELRYWGVPVPTLQSMAPDRVLHMSSFSKLLAPGIRLGYLVAPSDVVSRLAKWAIDTYIGPVCPTQAMAYEFFRRGLLEPNIEKLKGVYGPRLEATLAGLDEHIGRATWPRPEGGFFVGVTLPEGTDVVGLMERAPSVGLKLSDGRGFFPNPDDGMNFLRIPYCSLTPDEISEALQRLARIL
jgi:DNA-binding transcriptional MocR family regulator